jgi:hypothetical protein
MKRSRIEFCIEYYRGLFVDWFNLKKNECPLCGKRIKSTSVRNHIKNQTCVTLLALDARQRRQVVDEFHNRSPRMRARVPHELSDEELLAKEVTKMEEAVKCGRKLFVKCLLTNDKYQWIPNSVLLMSTVGRNFVRAAYRTGILR